MPGTYAYSSDLLEDLGEAFALRCKEMAPAELEELVLSLNPPEAVGEFQQEFWAVLAGRVLSAEASYSAECVKKCRETVSVSKEL